MLQRAYSLLEIKAVDDDARIIEGLASTPALDRQGDIMVAKGAKFKLPLPLLWQHKHDQPIGHVFAATASSDGIRIKARIEKGVLPFVDDAWALIKAKLVRGLSIGWRPLERPDILQEDGAYKYNSWEIFEVSAVTVPANAEATITAVKALDAPYLVASDKGTAARPTPGVSGVRQGTSMNISQQLTAKKAELQTKSTRLAELRQLSEQDGGLQPEQQTERTELLGEIKAISVDVDELSALEGAQMASTKSVHVQGHTARQAAESRGGSIEGKTVQVAKDTRPPGVAFAQYVRCKMAAYVTHRDPVLLAREYYPNDPRIATLLKGNTSPFSTADGANTGGTELVYAQNLVSEFVEYLRAQTIIGQFGTGGRASLRNVPFNVRIPGQGSAGAANWVGEQKLKPATKFNFNFASLGWAKAATIAVMSEELARFSNPSADALIRDELVNALRERLDIDFIDPDKALDSGVSPASITNGVTPLPSAGNDLEDVLSDLRSLLANFTTSLIGTRGVVLIMTDTTALGLSLMITPLGVPAFPEMTANGGSLRGIPVIVSEYARHGSPSNPMVVAVSAPNVFLADDGTVAVDMSREASIEMATDPENDTGTVVSLWQENLIALKAERFITWKKRRSEAVAFIRNVGWGEGSPA